MVPARPGRACKVVDVIDGAQSLLKIRLSDTYLASLASDGAPAADGAASEPSSLPSKGTEDQQAESDRIEKTALVPFVEQLVPDIDLDEGYLTLDPPGGLIPGLGESATASIGVKQYIDAGQLVC